MKYGSHIYHVRNQADRYVHFSGPIFAQGGYFQMRRSGGAWTSYQVRRQNLGQGPAKFPKEEEKLGKFCHHKTQMLGKSPNFGVISEIDRAKFGVFVTYIFGGTPGIFVCEIHEK